MPVTDELPVSGPTERLARARAIAAEGGFEAALTSGALPQFVDATLAEALVLGLLRQGVTRFVTVLGHGSTEVGEVLRVYEAAGVVRTFAVRNEIAASHAATALRWVRGEKAAVVTSIGPGALQAMAGSLVAASDGIGVWHLYGDETTEDEGPNMQQIPRAEQGLFAKLTSIMGASYSLHTPAALPTALRRGLNVVDHPHRAGPFYLLLPLNTQPVLMRDFNLAELPVGSPPPLAAAAGDHGEAARELLAAERVVIKVGGGARGCGLELLELADLVDGVLVTSPISVGVVPGSAARYLAVAGSKGSICGNFATEHADALLVVGARAVCQSDSSRTGYPNVRHVVNINADVDAAMHYQRTTALIGDARPTLRRLIDEVRAQLAAAPAGERVEAPPSGSAADLAEAPGTSAWLAACQAARAEWESFKAERFAHPTLYDEAWRREVLTQPAAIRIAMDAAHEAGAVVFFDAGDVQANGFQLADDEAEGRTFTDGGASYMGFASGAVLATALVGPSTGSGTGTGSGDGTGSGGSAGTGDGTGWGLGTRWRAVAMSGDGSFTMNPSVLIDAVEHGATGVIVVFDNRRMGAISSLQQAQYGAVHATSDSVEVDYVAWAGAIKGVKGIFGGHTPDELRAAMRDALADDGVALVHVPVYFGTDPLGGLGAYGRWNVGNWVADTQALRHRIGL